MDIAFLVFAVSLLVSAALVAFALLKRRPGHAEGTQGLSELAGTVRTEADRVRNDAMEQSARVRQELDLAMQRFQESLLGRFDVGIENIRQPITEIGHKLDDDINKMGKEAQENREGLREGIESRLVSFGDRQTNAARDLREELTGNFKHTADILSSTLRDLGTHQQARLDKVAAELRNMSEQQGTAQETLRKTVESRLDALRAENSAKLEEMRQTVDEKLQTALEKRLGESFRTVSEQLERVYHGIGEMQKLASTVGDFKRVLTNVKVRGTWTEVQLGLLLEQFLTPDQYVEKVAVKDGTAERVEYAIRLPGHDSGGVLLPIDAKFPSEDYDRIVQAAERCDADAVAAATLAFEGTIRAEAKKISEKYINPPTTTDFAVMYLATEGLYAEVLRRRSLLDQLQREFRVTVAGPTTLAALLNAFQMGFRSLAIQQRSSEVWQILGAVRAEFAEHGKVVQKLKDQLGAASNTVDALGTRTRVMNRKLKDVDLPTDGVTQKLLGLTTPVLVTIDGTEKAASTQEVESSIGRGTQVAA